MYALLWLSPILLKVSKDLDLFLVDSVGHSETSCEHFLALNSTKNFFALALRIYIDCMFFVLQIPLRRQLAQKLAFDTPLAPQVPPTKAMARSFLPSHTRLGAVSDLQADADDLTMASSLDDDVFEDCEVVDSPDSIGLLSARRFSTRNNSISMRKNSLKSVKSKLKNMFSTPNLVQCQRILLQTLCLIASLVLTIQSNCRFLFSGIIILQYYELFSALICFINLVCVLTSHLQ